MNIDAELLALEMVDLFATVGVRSFDTTYTDIAGVKLDFRPGLTLAAVRRAIPFLVPAFALQRKNLIIRPHTTRPPELLIQLDDVSGNFLERVRPLAFMVVETSPGNYQAWLAVTGVVGAILDRTAFGARVRQAVGADPGASGAVRVAGSLNFKPVYAPNFPMVRIVEAQPGRTVEAVELERLELVSPKEEHPRRFFFHPGQKWPSYQQCLDRAVPRLLSKKKGGKGPGPDTSKCDFLFCITAIDWGWGVTETAKRLIEESPDAKSKGEGYAKRTARNAEAVVRSRKE